VSADAVRKAVCSRVARILKSERVKQGLSMTAVSEQAGLSQQSISYIEREMRIPNLDTLLRISAVLKLDLELIIARARRETADEESAR
jgi:transcriptional regulator with XRE-family HTH domain